MSRQLPFQDAYNTLCGRLLRYSYCSHDSVLSRETLKELEGLQAKTVRFFLVFRRGQ